MDKYDTITEICDVTGSWLKDFRIDKEILSLGSLNELNKQNPFFIDFNHKIYHDICDKLDVSTTKLIVRRRSLFERELNYLMHTNRELDLMLKGKKDLAVFKKTKGEDFNSYGDQLFEKFSNFIFCYRWLNDNVEICFYYTAGNLWRVKSYMEIICCRNELGNSRPLEFLEGLLLGYSKEQNLEFLNKFFPIK